MYVCTYVSPFSCETSIKTLPDMWNCLVFVQKGGRGLGGWCKNDTGHFPYQTLHFIYFCIMCLLVIVHGLSFSHIKDIARQYNTIKYNAIKTRIL